MAHGHLRQASGTAPQEQGLNSESPYPLGGLGEWLSRLASGSTSQGAIPVGLPLWGSENFGLDFSSLEGAGDEMEGADSARLPPYDHNKNETSSRSH